MEVMGYGLRDPFLMADSPTFGTEQEILFSTEAVDLAFPYRAAIALQSGGQTAIAPPDPTEGQVTNTLP